MPIEPGVLEGQVVRLEPLALSHVPALITVGLDPALSEWTIDSRRTPDEMRAYVENAIAEREAGRAYPFATIDRATNTVVGSTRFAGIVPEHRRLEIGWTWIAKPWQRTAINTEAKYLMLRYVFEELRYHRVEIKTDALNMQSRRAIERLGAVYEGTFRRHMICEDGRVRDTVYYAIVDDEWPRIKADLEAKLQHR